MQAAARVLSGYLLKLKRDVPLIGSAWNRRCVALPARRRVCA
jgi:hypothetical protein